MVVEMLAKYYRGKLFNILQFKISGKVFFGWRGILNLNLPV